MPRAPSPVAPPTPRSTHAVPPQPTGARPLPPRRRPRHQTRLWTAAALLALAAVGHAQTGLSLPGQVEGIVKVGQFQGGFFGGLVPGDGFGDALAALGDVDGDGVQDLAVGAPQHAGEGSWRGAVWILFLEADGTVRDWQLLSDTQGDLPQPPLDGDRFGSSLAPLGDLDGDGVPDLAVGVPGQDDGGPDLGAVRLLLLRPDGSVREQRVISATQGGFGGTLLEGDGFGGALARPGDLDGDGLADLVVGSRFDDDGGLSSGAFWVLFLEADGTVRAQQKVSALAGGLRADLDPIDFFAWSLAGLGDLDGDGVPDLAAGTPNDSDDSAAHGAVYVLLMRPDGTVRDTIKINHLTGGLDTPLDSVDLFGQALAGPGDVDGDGVPDLAVGAPFDDDVAPGTETQGNSRGAVYLLFLRPDGTVRAHHKLSDAAPTLAGKLLGGSGFGNALAALGDRDGDGTPDLVVGHATDPGFGGPPNGAAWALRLHGPSWLDLGGGFGPGPDAGPPTLTGSGTLLPSAPLTVHLASRLPHTPLTLVLGLDALGVPLAAGVLGPLPQVLLPAVTDGEGRLTLDDRWPPEAEPGSSVLLQAWLAGPDGLLAASGTLEATAP